MSWIDQRPDDAMDGAFTAVAPEPIVSVEPTLFREAMARLGAAGRQDRFHRDRGLLSVRYTGNAAGMS